MQYSYLQLYSFCWMHFGMLCWYAEQAAAAFDRKQQRSCFARDANDDQTLTMTTPAPSSHPSPPLPRLPRPFRRGGFQGRRTVSTQGDEQDQVPIRTDEFAVRSIRRGSQEWRALVKPFVADLAYCNITSRAFTRQPLVRPFTCQTAVLFVDISGYSRIAAALASKGAHALSVAVNSYLQRLLRIVRQYGGDIVKLAGDAVLCVWHGSKQEDAQQQKDHVKQHVLAAAVCATQLQAQAGTHVVQDTPHTFSIHVGLCCGTVESEIFVAPQHVNMQRLFHLVGGEALKEIGDLVDLAKSGQVCVSANVAHILQHECDTDTVQATFATVEQTLHKQDGDDMEDIQDIGRRRQSRRGRMRG